jgi:hypothetical protein
MGYFLCQHFAAVDDGLTVSLAIIQRKTTIIEDHSRIPFAEKIRLSVGKGL